MLTKCPVYLRQNHSVAAKELKVFAEARDSDGIYNLLQFLVKCLDNATNAYTLEKQVFEIHTERLTN